MYQYTIQADNVSDLQTWGPKLLAAITQLPGFQDVSTDQQNGGLDQLLTYDRVTAARLGQTASSLDSALYSEFGQSEVSLIYTQLNQYYVVLEVAPQYWATPDGLKSVYLHPSAQELDGQREHAAVQHGQGAGQYDAAGAEPHGAVSVGDGVVQPGAEHVAERRDAGHRPDAAEAGHSVDGARLLRGNGAGVSAVAEQRADADR